MEKDFSSSICKTLLPTLVLCTQLHADAPSSGEQNSTINGSSHQAKKRDNHFWAEAEYLLWWLKDSPKTVPMVTTGPTVPNLAPVLGLPGTKIVLGDKSIDNHARSGGRFTVYWYYDQVFSTEINYLFLAKGSTTHSVNSDGLPDSEFLALPFFDVTTPGESSTRIALPGSFAGKALLKISNTMQGAEWDILARLYSSKAWDLRILAGFRYWNFNESLTFNTNSPSVIPPIDVFKTKDQFRTHNNFYGGQIGLETECSLHRFFINAKGKIALGAMCEKLNINGKLITNDFDNFGETQTFSGGYFALPTNIGHHSRNTFAFIPEVNLNFGYQVLKWLNVQVGYTFLYVSKVLWASNQIDRNINPSQAPAIENSATGSVTGTPRPIPLFRTTNFWAQGLNIGLQFRF